MQRNGINRTRGSIALYCKCHILCIVSKMLRSITVAQNITLFIEAVAPIQTDVTLTFDCRYQKYDYTD